MDEIGKEETALEAQVAELRSKLAGADSINVTISSAETLLARLRKRLDEPISWEVKRRLVEVLIASIQVDTFEDWGVKQTSATVNYRFSQPDQPMPLIVTQSYGGRLVRIPTEPKTIGDHIRKRRLSLKLLQREVAEQIGVDATSVFNWEANNCQPELRHIPAIIAFIGYNPLPESEGWGGQVVRCRTTLGLTQKEAAGRLGVDQGTLANWEQGKRDPTGAFMSRVQRFLDDDEERRSSSRRAG